MRPDQLLRLAEVSERLAEVVIRDIDPESWGSAHASMLGDMTREERGDQAWCRKTAVQSVALLVRVEQLLTPASDPVESREMPDPEADIKRAERAATEMLERLGKREPAR